MRMIFTKVSMPKGYPNAAQELAERFGPVAANDAVAVMVLPANASVLTMEGARLTVVTTENYGPALQEIERNYREFDAQTIGTQRLYMLYMKVERAAMDGIERGEIEPESLDGATLARFLRAL